MSLLSGKLIANLCTFARSIFFSPGEQTGEQLTKTPTIYQYLHHTMGENGEGTEEIG